MSYGLLVENNNGQIIISDSTTTFYYYGPAEAYQVTGTPDYGGVTVRLYNTYTSKPIIPFIKPNDGNAVAITRIFRGANNYWNLELAIAGTASAAPEVVVFTTSDAENWSSRFNQGSKTYGMAVFRADGSTAFNSNVGQPLAVRGALSVIPPAEPTAGGQSLTPVNYNEYNLPAGITTPMFGYYSMAMSERQYQVNQVRRDCTGIGYGGVCIGFSDTVVQSDLYWAFYRAGLSINGSKARAAWLTYAKGQLTNTTTSSSFSLFIPIISLGGGSYTSGAGPFVNQTINLTNAPVLLADRASYPNSDFAVTIPPANAPTALTVITDYQSGGTTLYLMAAWKNASSYPFALSYAIYYRKQTDSAWISAGSTNLETAGITITDNVAYVVRVYSIGASGTQDGYIDAVSTPYVAPAPVTGAPDYSGGDTGGGGDAGAGTGDAGTGTGDAGAGSGDGGAGAGGGDGGSG